MQDIPCRTLDDSCDDSLNTQWSASVFKPPFSFSSTLIDVQNKKYRVANGLKNSKWVETYHVVEKRLICSSCLSLQPQSNQSWYLYNVLLAFLYHASKSSKQGSILSQTSKKLLSAGCWGILIFRSLHFLFDFRPVESLFWQSELICWGWATRGILSFKVRSFCQVIIHGQPTIFTYRCLWTHCLFQLITPLK